MRFKIQVTNEDIRKGRRGTICHCPIARAVKRELGAAGREVRVFPTLLRFQNRRLGQFDICMPSEAKAFVKDFDGGEQVQPFEFDIKI
jgi:hypothetical protein